MKRAGGAVNWVDIWQQVKVAQYHHRSTTAPRRLSRSVRQQINAGPAMHVPVTKRDQGRDTATRRDLTWHARRQPGERASAALICAAF